MLHLSSTDTRIGSVSEGHDRNEGQRAVTGGGEGFRTAESADAGRRQPGIAPLVNGGDEDTGRVVFHHGQRDDSSANGYRTLCVP
jgi:hypothetical protein